MPGSDINHKVHASTPASFGQFLGKPKKAAVRRKAAIASRQDVLTAHRNS